MADGFQLFQLPAELRERICSKFEWKAYFRMQQTCHDMADFIQTSPYIKVHLPEEFYLEILVNYFGFIKYYSKSKAKKREAEFESLYGTRFDYIDIHQGPRRRNFLSECCEILKKYRITAGYINTFYLKEYSNEQYEELLKILKPKKISFDSRGSKRWEILMTAKEMRDVSIEIDLKDLQPIMENFPEWIEVLDIRTSTEELEPCFTAINKILEHFQTRHLPELRSFTFNVLHDDPLPRANDMREIFDVFHPILIVDLEEYDSYEIKCQLGLDNRLCKLEFDYNSVELLFKYVDDN